MGGFTKDKVDNPVLAPLVEDVKAIVRGCNINRRIQINSMIYTSRSLQNGVIITNVQHFQHTFVLWFYIFHIWFRKTFRFLF